jgi:hypothetical protein
MLTVASALTSCKTWLYSIRPRSIGHSAGGGGHSGGGGGRLGRRTGRYQQRSRPSSVGRQIWKSPGICSTAFHRSLERGRVAGVWRPSGVASVTGAYRGPMSWTPRDLDQPSACGSTSAGPSLQDRALTGADDEGYQLPVFGGARLETCHQVVLLVGSGLTRGTGGGRASAVRSGSRGQVPVSGGR